MFGIPAESFFCLQLIKAKLRAPNVDIEGQYFTTNVHSSNAVNIANTLTKYPQYKVKPVWSKCFQDQIENPELTPM